MRDLRSDFCRLPAQRKIEAVLCDAPDGKPVRVYNSRLSWFNLSEMGIFFTSTHVMLLLSLMPALFYSECMRMCVYRNAWSQIFVQQFAIKLYVCWVVADPLLLLLLFTTIYAIGWTFVYVVFSSLNESFRLIAKNMWINQQILIRVAQFNLNNKLNDIVQTPGYC